MKEAGLIRRYELKYALDERAAEKIMDYIQPICALDPNTPRGEGGYTVNTVYFDTDDMTFYYDTKLKKMTRYKPRVRFYGTEPPRSVYAELKYRNSSVIWKSRQKVMSSEWESFVAPDFEGAPIVKDGIGNFQDVVRTLSINPVLQVRYYRVPFVCDVCYYGRITFDRRISYRRLEGGWSPEIEAAPDEFIMYDDPIITTWHESPVLLEIKVETDVPEWTIELIRKFGLNQRGFSKYCYAVDRMLSDKPTERISVYK